MKTIRNIFLLLLCWLPATMWAKQLVEADPISGVVYEVTNPVGCDRMFVFRVLNDASFKTINGESATWTELVTGAKTEGYNTFQDVKSGYCYQVQQGDQIETFVVIDYSDHRLLAQRDLVEVEMKCNNTVITVPNLAISYYTDSLLAGQYKKAIWPSHILVTYNDQQWGEKDWETVEVNDTVEWVSEAMTFDSILDNTKFTLVETLLSEFFYGEADSITTTEYEAVAVAHHQQYFITKRGNKYENEKEGPYEGNISAHSAPLDVLFESHPSKKADVYNWTIKRGNDVRTQRTDKDLRFTFDEAAEGASITYMIYLEVINSDHPECVSTAQDTITLNSSFLLVPNVFTPNGDGINDEFRVAYRSICEFHCWVYNRWQHLVYQWDDPSKGWDGTYAGQKESDSAFIYIIDARGCDGKRYKLKGTVNLLRGQ